MSVPPLDAHGLLPAGVHDVTLDQIAAAFGSSNPRRKEIFDKLTQFVAFARGFGLFTAIFVDGSFTTDKDLPRDVDVVLELPRLTFPGLLGHPNAVAILDGKAVKAKYEVHLFIQAPPTPMADLFQTLKTDEAIDRSLPPDHKRGILKVNL